jgi:hypothetical protein
MKPPTLLRCAHVIRPEIPKPVPGIIGHPNNLDAFDRKVLEEQADPCNALAMLRAADGSPRCQVPDHGGVALLPAETLAE